MTTSRTPRLEFFMMIALSVAFFALKYPYMHLPYYWDELGVYSKGSLYMAEHGISLMPSALDPELSRGHPLLSFVVLSIPYKLFGANIFYAHAYMNLLGIAVLWLVYAAGNRMFQRPVGIVGAVLLASQPVFIAQAGLVLPEVLLGLFMLLAVYFFFRDNLWGYAAASIAAMLTKETAIVLPLVVLIPALLLWMSGQNRRPSVLSALVAFVPWVVYLLFLLVQKAQHGWYFFPLHANSIDLGSGLLLHRLADFLLFGFLKQGRYLWLLLLVAGGIKALMNMYPQAKEKQAVFLLGFLAAGVLGFSCLNFYMDRYLMPSIVALSVLTGAFVVHFGRGNTWLTLLLTVVLAVNSLMYVNPGKFNYDVDMSYVPQVKALQEAVVAIEKLDRGGKPIMCNFPLNFALLNEPHGYRTTDEEIPQEYGANLPNEKDMWIGYSDPGSWDPNFPQTDTMERVIFVERDFVRISVHKNH